MDLALTAVEGLRQIYDLVDAIRRQRSQNRKTYMRMMQIYVELQSEPVRANPTLQRTQAIERFAYAVAMFYDHLQKYHDMHRVVRIFKWAKMEDSRLHVVEEVDRLFQMLNLATTVTVMEGHAAAASNAARLFAKIEDLHSEIRLTHDQIHAALLADKQQFRVVDSTVENDVVRRGLNRQAPLKSYGRIVLDKKLSMRDENEPESEFEPEEKTAVADERAAEEWIGSKTLPLIKKIELAELKQQAVNEEEEEKEPSEVLSSTDEEEEKEQQLEQEEEEEPEQQLVGELEEVEGEEKEQQLEQEEEEEPEQQLELEEVEGKEKEQQLEQEEEEEPEQQPELEEVEGEEKEQGDLELVVFNSDDKEEVEEEKEPQEKEQPIGQEAELQVEDEGKSQNDQQLVTTQHAVDVVVENQQEEEKEINLEILVPTEDQQQQENEEKIESLAQVEEEEETNLKPDLDHNGVDEVGDQREEEEMDPLAQTDEKVDPTLSPQLSSSSLLEDSSVPLLIKLLGSGEATIQETEEALLDLIAKCVSNSNRVQVYKTKGIPVLREIVRSSESYLAQLYALHCLSWFTFSFSKVREAEFEELQACVREPTHSEMLSLLHELQNGDEHEKEVAVLQCSCLATRGDGEALRRLGVFPLLIDLLTNGTANQKLWATEALVSDSDESCMEITSEGRSHPSSHCSSAVRHGHAEAGGRLCAGQFGCERRYNSC